MDSVFTGRNGFTGDDKIVSQQNELLLSGGSPEQQIQCDGKFVSHIEYGLNEQSKYSIHVMLEAFLLLLRG